MSPFKTVTHFIEKYQNAYDCYIANKQSNNKLKINKLIMTRYLCFYTQMYMI